MKRDLAYSILISLDRKAYAAAERGDSEELAILEAKIATLKTKFNL